MAGSIRRNTGQWWTTNWRIADMDLMNDWLPISSNELGMLCESDYMLLSDFIRVERLFSIPFSGTEYSRLPLFFRVAIPFLTPPDKVSIIGNSVSVSWNGKIIKLSSDIVDPLGRIYYAGCIYSVPPSSVSIYFHCCGLDQFYIEYKYGNKEGSFTFIKPPYLPVLILHVANTISPESADCSDQLSTKNTDISYLNRDSYSLYDLLMLIYHWRITIVDSQGAEVDPLSPFVMALAEPDMAHINMSLGCSVCLPAAPHGSAMNQYAFYDLISRSSPWIGDTPVEQFLAGYTLLNLGGLITPIFGLRGAFKPKDNYWVTIYTEAPDPDNQPDFYLIHSDIIILAKCGETYWFSHIRYGTDFIPNTDCISLGGDPLVISGISGDIRSTTHPFYLNGPYGSYGPYQNSYIGQIGGWVISAPGEINYSQARVLADAYTDTANLFSVGEDMAREYYMKVIQNRLQIFASVENLTPISDIISVPAYVNLPEVVPTEAGLDSLLYYIGPAAYKAGITPEQAVYRTFIAYRDLVLIRYPNANT